MLEKLRKKRKEYNLTVYDMANLLHLKSASTYSKKERGEIPINIDEAKKICLILRCSMDEIFLNKNYLNKIE
jgi:transcriptional regulator with XRE-family HTH domain